MKEKDESDDITMDMSQFNDPGLDDIGDVPLTLQIIAEQRLSVRQIFRGHTPINGVYKCKLCNDKLQNDQDFVVHLIRGHKLQIKQVCS